MKKQWKWIVCISIASILLVGCGTSGASDPANGGSETAEDVPKDTKDVITKEQVSTDLKYEDGKYIFTLKNITEHDVHLSFSSSQEYEYKIFDSEGEHIYTYSMDKTFLMATSEKTLLPGEEYVMEVDVEVLSTLEKDTYTLEIWSTALDSEGLKSEIEITNNELNKEEGLLDK